MTDISESIEMGEEATAEMLDGLRKLHEELLAEGKAERSVDVMFAILEIERLSANRAAAVGVNVGAGWVLVPPEPTEAMEAAYERAASEKLHDIYSPTPTERYDDGGGAFGYGYRAMLKAAPAVGVNVGVGWQPISTAPLDMTEVIGLNAENGRIYKTWFFAPSSITRNWLRAPGNMRWKPTHWMPLPEPPSSVGVEVGVAAPSPEASADTSTG